MPAFSFQAKNLDDLIKAHSTYVEKLYDRCLLSQKVWCKLIIRKAPNVFVCVVPLAKG